LAGSRALSLLPSRGLSSASVVRRVSVTAVLCNGQEKNGLTMPALSDMCLHQAPWVSDAVSLRDVDQLVTGDVFVAISNSGKIAKVMVIANPAAL
jgi:hypothetical protein